MRRVTIGIVANADAGKTTFTEALLFNAGKLRSLGRVDHGNAFLDTGALEKERGITIYSKQAVFEYENVAFTLLDSPGHVDFTGEMQKIMPALDAAIMIISAADKVTAQTEVMWKLLEYYSIPVFVFVNKMDQGYEREEIKAALKKLSSQILELDDYENIAMTDEIAMEEYLNTDIISLEKIEKFILQRDLFPLYWGSALKNQGVMEFLQSFCGLQVGKDYEKLHTEPLSGIVFKIIRDEKGNRYSFFKITAGTIHPKDMIGEEKISQILISDGAKFIQVNEAVAGQVVCLFGPEETYIGQGIGAEQDADFPLLCENIKYRLILPQNTDKRGLFKKIDLLNDEDPLLQLTFDEEDEEIFICLMGQLHRQVVKKIFMDRFKTEISYQLYEEYYEEKMRRLSELEAELILLENEENQQNDDSTDQGYRDENGHFTGFFDFVEPEEIDAILARATHANAGKNTKKAWHGSSVKRRMDNNYIYQEPKHLVAKERYMLVDGYNLIHAWPELKAIIADSLDGARGRLQDMLCDYRGLVNQDIIIVYDAYNVPGPASVEDYGNIHLVFTKEAQTADAYIMKFSHENSKKYDITVVTSDGMEQLIIRGDDCRLMSSREFIEEYERTKESISGFLKK